MSVRRESDAHASTSFAILSAIAIVLPLITAMPVRAHSEIAIPADGGQVLSVANYSLDKGDKVEYSFAADGLVEFSVRCYFEFDVWFPAPIMVMLVIEDTSASGTFEATLDTPSSGGHWVYRFGFKNLEDRTVTVEYDIHRPGITRELIILLTFLLLGSALVVAIIARVALARRQH
ncbi:MAG: hypothetical protein ACUVT7_05380 [Thermoplasmata archaeon]